MSFNPRPSRAAAQRAVYFVGSIARQEEQTRNEILNFEQYQERSAHIETEPSRIVTLTPRSNQGRQLLQTIAETNPESARPVRTFETLRFSGNDGRQRFGDIVSRPIVIEDDLEEDDFNFGRQAGRLVNRYAENPYCNNATRQFIWIPESPWQDLVDREFWVRRNAQAVSRGHEQQESFVDTPNIAPGNSIDHPIVVYEHDWHHPTAQTNNHFSSMTFFDAPRQAQPTFLTQDDNLHAESMARGASSFPVARSTWSNDQTWEMRPDMTPVDVPDLPELPPNSLFELDVPDLPDLPPNPLFDNL